MNGIIDDITFQQKADALLTQAVTLIKAEIPHLNNTQPTNVAGPAPQPSISSISGQDNTKTSIGGGTGNP